MRSHLFLGVALAAAGMLGMAGCQSSRTTAMARTERPAPAPAPERAAAPLAPPAAASSLPAVYFELDRWDLREDARKQLKSNAKQIQAHADSGVIRIEGHCDERGSDEYNLALGERRAEAVKRYLVDLGVPADRFQTVSYGESRPAARGEGERAWSLNRRSEIRIELRQAAR